MRRLASLELRKAFTKQANGSHLVEYWPESEFTSVPRSAVVPHVWKWDDVKALIVEDIASWPAWRRRNGGLLCSRTPGSVVSRT